jgi:phosphocarrier protein
MIRQVLTVRNRLGLHARAAAKLVRLVMGFRSRVSLSREDTEDAVEGGSILGILMLAAARGAHIAITVEGTDEAEAAEAIRRFFEERFGEEI